jgi:NitT/TauT family transport system permease protein
VSAPTAEVTSSRRPSLPGALRTVVLLAATPAVLILAWAATAALVDSSLVAGPWDSTQQMADILTSSRYQESLLDTVQVLAVSYALAVGVGGLIGFALGLSPFWNRAFSPLIQGFYSIPKVTLFPLFLVFLGLGVLTRTSFAFVHGVFPVMIVVMAATANLRLDPIYLKLAASLRMSYGRLVRTILLPAVLPSFLTAARLGFGVTFLGLLLAEMLIGNGGLGEELVRNIHLVRIDRILGQVVLIGLLALIPNALLRLLEVRVTRRMQGDVRG